MDRWIIFRIKVVSFITNKDNSWLTFPSATDFNDMNKEFFSYSGLTVWNVISKSVNVLQSCSKDFETSI